MSNSKSRLRVSNEGQFPCQRIDEMRLSSLHPFYPRIQIYTNISDDTAPTHYNMRPHSPLSNQEQTLTPNSTERPVHYLPIHTRDVSQRGVEARTQTEARLTPTLRY